MLLTEGVSFNIEGSNIFDKISCYSKKEYLVWDKGNNNSYNYTYKV